MTHKLSVAPMMEWSDRFCRSLHRVLSRRARLYTEMVTTGAVLHGPRERLLGFDAEEHFVAVQLGGSDPADLAKAARICADFGYDEINLNVGCPSDRVQNGRFGACLMLEPALVGECVAAMKAAVSLPVTVKCRIGVDDQDSEEAVDTLTAAVVAAGCDELVVHARKAWLKGLSPKENRDVPPLDYSRVYRLKQARPNLPIGINGGIKTMAETHEHLRHVDSVMLGRVAYHEPEILLAVDPELYGEEPPVADAFEAIEAYEPYIAARLAEGHRLHTVTRHMLGLFTGRPGARAYRRHLATEGTKPGASLQTLRDAVAHVSRDSADLEDAA
ncbi:tRNA dihydrouridine(20/20a) synthase DusA [Microvirga brassicacearum]|uniref:tRNA-dihydrouridine(20/20a) synthase n=1 Tax=Microvirga brassicacearum TaxID=2580413 RepID=A0A5N3P506_9HYPH|nr:tRNA dihydrouridine(20/20a) synthase DusA [Microvirga brassicacearum]KAB0264806.1 tRNA dihydrouridine(20/20a) synthase DusA [Microvirga brassicacearum]